MLMDGLVLMTLGMGGVFIFLGILVLMMNFASAFFKKYAHLFPEEKQESKSPLSQIAHDDATDIAVAIAAVKALENHS